MDALTHIFLPLTIIYVLRSELFESSRYLAFGLLGLLPDFDKFLGLPGLLHSVITLVSLCLVLFALESYSREQLIYSNFVVFFLVSHLLLDLLDGSGVYLLYPVIQTGIGLEYPMQITFGEGPLGISFQGYPVSAFLTQPRSGFAADATIDANTYGFINAFGVTSTILFVIIYVGLERCPSNR